VILLGSARDLLGPAGDLRRVFGGVPWFGTDLVTAIVLRALEHAERSSEHGSQRVGERVDEAPGRRWRRSENAVGPREQVDVQHGRRAVDGQPRLLDVAGQLELPLTALAADHRAPVVEREVGVGAHRAPLGLDVLDRSEQLLDQVEAVHAEAAERMPRVAVPRWQRAALVRWVLQAADEVDGDDVTDVAGLDRVERALDLRLGEERVVVRRDGHRCSLPDSSDLLDEHGAGDLGRTDLVDGAAQVTRR